MVRHQPHLYLPNQWEGPDLQLSHGHARHLSRVLKMRHGDAVTYTDGRGNKGQGLLGDGRVVRGLERHVARPSTISIAVVPVKATERMRFMVEKLQELGVERLTWLTSDHGRAPAPKEAKASAWAIAALEQSRGAWRMEIDGPVGLGELDRAVLADGTGRADIDPSVTICIGPEGGWSESEIRSGRARVSLGSTVLRTETATIAAAVRAISLPLASGD